MREEYKNGIPATVPDFPNTVASSGDKLFTLDLVGICHDIENLDRVSSFPHQRHFVDWRLVLIKRFGFNIITPGVKQKSYNTWQ
jgi:hypothetical protein